jgi:hypothetical protein
MATWFIRRFSAMNFVWVSGESKFPGPVRGSRKNVQKRHACAARNDPRARETFETCDSIRTRRVPRLAARYRSVNHSVKLGRFRVARPARRLR